ALAQSLKAAASWSWWGTFLSSAGSGAMANTRARIATADVRIAVSLLEGDKTDGDRNREVACKNRSLGLVRGVGPPTAPVRSPGSCLGRSYFAPLELLRSGLDRRPFAFRRDVSGRDYPPEKAFPLTVSNRVR